MRKSDVQKWLEYSFSSEKLEMLYGNCSMSKTEPPVKTKVLPW